MGEEIVGSYLRSKLESILDEAENDTSPWPIISRFRSIERHINSDHIPIDPLYELIHELSECRVFGRKAAAFKKKGFYWFRVFWFKRNMTLRLQRIEEKLRNPVPASSSSSSSIPAAAQQHTCPVLQDPSLIVGLESEAEEIEGWLVRDKIERVGIVGRCGVGKTALAHKVLSSEGIQKEFCPRIWVCLSNEGVLNYYNLEESAAGGGGGGHYSCCSVAQLVEEVMGKRYLIVLDDVWRWVDEDLLPRGSGGAVISTSRRDENHKHVIRMEPLRTDEICRTIIFNLARKQVGMPKDQPLLISMEQQIVENCDGLPLAAKALATVFTSWAWIPARELYIAWGNDTAYWRWISLPPPQLEEAAVLVEVCWLEIRGRVESKKLFLKTNYSAYLVFKLGESCYGLREAMMAQVRFGSKGEKIPLIEGGEQGCSSVYISGDGFRQRAGEKEWMEIKLGNFFNDDANDEVEAALYEVQRLHWKSGLIVKGIHFRPNYS